MQNINNLIQPNETLTKIFIGQDIDTSYDVSSGGLLNLYFLSIGNQLNVQVHLIGEHAAVNIKTVYLSDTQQNNKISFLIEHNSPVSKSSQLIKGIAKGTGYSDFYGLIRIPHNSQKCEGSQTHKALLLSDNAQIKATPELEIYADDVKCSHGSSIGALDKNSLFYLLSRGIDEKQAKRMLINAFLLSDMPSEFEQEIMQWMTDHE